MRQFIWTTAALVCLFSLCNIVESRHVVVKREGSDSAIDPNFQDVDEDDSYRDKRKVDDVKFGVKNAVLGFVFNKINSFLDQKTHWVDQLDRTNIAKNKAAGIEPPKDPIVSLSGIISGAIGQKLQQAAPLLNIVTSKLTSGSSSGGGFKGFNLGALLGGSAGGGAHANVAVGANPAPLSLPTAYGGHPGAVGASFSGYGAV